MKLNEKLVVLRKRAGMTQEDMARALEVSRQSVHKWESGQCYPEVPKLVGMKAIFGISIDDLLDDSVEMELPEKKKAKKISAEKEIKEETAEPSVAMPLSGLFIPAVTEEKKEEPVVEEMTVEVIENEKTVEEAPAEIKKEPEAKTEEIEAEKKKGFFAKFFGRK